MGELKPTPTKEDPQASTITGPSPQATGNAVAMIGCDTKDMGLVVDPKNDQMNYLVLNPGKDNVTTVSGAVKAVNGLVSGYMENGVEAGIAKANSALTQSGRVFRQDRGDKIERRGTMTETIEIKVPPDRIPP